MIDLCENAKILIIRYTLLYSINFDCVQIKLFKNNNII